MIVLENGDVFHTEADQLIDREETPVIDKLICIFPKERTVIHCVKQFPEARCVTVDGRGKIPQQNLLFGQLSDRMQKSGFTLPPCFVSGSLSGAYHTGNNCGNGIIRFVTTYPR